MTEVEVRKINPKNRKGKLFVLEDGRECEMLTANRYRYLKPYDAESVLDTLTDDMLFSMKDNFFELDGDIIKANSQRYQVFKKKGCTCSKCGLKGTFFYKEKDLNSSRFHLNLYGVNEKGEEILFTKDHILAKSNGGSNHIDNYQTMCSICNEVKGSMSQQEFDNCEMQKGLAKHNTQTYTVDEMFKLIRQDNVLITEDGYSPKLLVDGTRIRVKGSTVEKITKEYLVCRECGRQPNLFKKEKEGKHWHINAYITDSEGREQLFMPNVFLGKLLKKGCLCYNCNRVK